MTKRDEVWLKAWCAVASAWNSENSSVCDSWADKCLKAYDDRFFCEIIGEPEDVFGTLINVDVTSCCKAGPIVEENYCPQCGKKINRPGD